MTTDKQPDLAATRAQLEADRAELWRRRAETLAAQAVADLAPRLGFRSARIAYRSIPFETWDCDPKTGAPRNVLDPLTRLAREEPYLLHGRR